MRIWIQGTQVELDRYEPLVGKVWRAFPDYFVHPLPDNGVQGNKYNPDSAIDIYFLPRLTFSPREPTHQHYFHGQAKPWPPTTDHTSSGYVLITSGYDPDRTLRLIAHELAHVSQMRYDTTEVENDSQWLVESTAEWVAYMIMKSIRVTPDYDYDLLDPSASVRVWPPLFNRLHHLGLDHTYTRICVMALFFIRIYRSRRRYR